MKPLMTQYLQVKYDDSFVNQKNECQALPEKKVMNQRQQPHLKTACVLLGHD
jgi:hypothetical protein